MDSIHKKPGLEMDLCLLKQNLGDVIWVREPSRPSVLPFGTYKRHSWLTFLGVKERNGVCVY